MEPTRAWKCAKMLHICEGGTWQRAPRRCHTARIYHICGVRQGLRVCGDAVHIARSTWSPSLLRFSQVHPKDHRSFGAVCRGRDHKGTHHGRPTAGEGSESAEQHSPDNAGFGRVQFLRRSPNKKTENPHHVQATLGRVRCARHRAARERSNRGPSRKSPQCPCHTHRCRQSASMHCRHKALQVGRGGPSRGTRERGPSGVTMGSPRQSCGRRKTPSARGCT
jgi:hypothetical protein